MIPVSLYNRFRFKNRIASSFGTKVMRYGHNAIVQRKLLLKLLPYITDGSRDGSLWADLGCGDGTLEKNLQERGFKGEVIGLDIAMQSLHHCRTAARDRNRYHWVGADVEFPPLKTASLDGVVAASVLQWFEKPDEVLQNITASLKQNGTFVFSIFTRGSFHELIDVRRFHSLPISVTLPDEQKVPPLLESCGLTPVTSCRFRETLHFPSAYRLLQHLSMTGSTSVTSNHLTRTGLRKFCSVFEDRFADDKGVPLTYRAVFGYARKGGSHAL